MKKGIIVLMGTVSIYFLFPSFSIAEIGCQFAEAQCKFVLSTMNGPVDCITLTEGQGIGYVTVGLTFSDDGVVSQDRSGSAFAGDTVCFYGHMVVYYWDPEYDSDGDGRWCATTDTMSPYEVNTKNGVDPFSWFVFAKTSSPFDYSQSCVDYDPCYDATQAAIVSCGSIESIIWDNVDNCQYHCESCDDECKRINLGPPQDCTN